MDYIPIQNVVLVTDNVQNLLVPLTSMYSLHASMGGGTLPQATVGEIWEGFMMSHNAIRKLDVNTSLKGCSYMKYSLVQA